MVPYDRKSVLLFLLYCHRQQNENLLPLPFEIWDLIFGFLTPPRGTKTFIHLFNPDSFFQSELIENHGDNSITIPKQGRLSFTQVSDHRIHLNQPTSSGTLVKTFAWGFSLECPACG
eukprot:m.199792 g.199792  ORF g.199792 m.199792 type:complete len:117 (+) comp25925_c1_seq6:56-406(+)